MEEHVGQLWHRFITRSAEKRYPAAAVRLEDMTRRLGVFFRAMGGDPGLRLSQSTEDHHGRRRRWLARIAGSGERLFLARRDPESLRLPPSIDFFPEKDLNRDLYYWLAALAASLDEQWMGSDTNGILHNQAATVQVLQTWPGLAARYHRLVSAYLPRRVVPQGLPPAEAQREHAIRQALQQPGSLDHVPPVPAHAPPAEPVLLWLQYAEGRTRAAGANEPGAGGESAGASQEGDGLTHKAERVDAPREKHGLLLPFRAESLLSLAEFFRLNRSVDDDGDPDTHAARDL